MFDFLKRLVVRREATPPRRHGQWPRVRAINGSRLWLTLTASFLGSGSRRRRQPFPVGIVDVHGDGDDLIAGPPPLRI